MDGNATATGLRITPIAPAIGAEIRGVDLAADLPDASALVRLRNAETRRNPRRG